MTKQITPLRQRMLDDMALRNMSPATQRLYINGICCKFVRRIRIG